jgi:flagellar biosynthesis/type III secretory pathway protein FliH
MENADYTIYSDRLIERVEVIEDSSYVGSAISGSAAESATAEIGRLCQTLSQMVDKINAFHENNVKNHREAIAKLSVEIARRILVKKISDKDYQIEEIVKEALKNAPVRKGVTVCVSPQDFAELQKLQTGGSGNILEGIDLVPDSAVGPAECIIKTSKGTIRSLLDEQLERIGQALAGSG